MSKVAITGNTSGTGVFTVASPNSNVDRVLTLPDESGTVLTTATPGVPVNGPAFSAYASTNQSISNATWTKVSFQAEEFDTAGAFDSTTNHQFQPLVAGYYQITAAFSPTTNVSQANIAIYKNGVKFKASQSIGSYTGAVVSALVYLNGSTDYVEAYGLFVGTTPTISGSQPDTFFQAAMVRAT